MALRKRCGWLSLQARPKSFFYQPGHCGRFSGHSGLVHDANFSPNRFAGICIYLFIVEAVPPQLRFSRDLRTCFGPAPRFHLYRAAGCTPIFFAATTNLAEFGEVIRIYVFPPLSHNWYIVGLFILNVFILSRLGLETMARLAKLLAYPMLLGYLTVVALGIQNYDINNIFPPLFGSGLKKRRS